jgi:DNA-binding MarR family transcriptional regulator
MAGKQNALRKEKKVEAAPAAAPVAGVGAPKLDRLIHERLRLGILSALSVNESLTFNELKKLLETTDGNLSVHARKLEEAGYVSCTKSFEGRMPRSDYKMTPAGRRALERYLDHMEALIQAMREK